MPHERLQPILHSSFSQLHATTPTCQMRPSNVMTVSIALRAAQNGESAPSPILANRFGGAQQGESRGCRHPGRMKPRDHGIERAPARTI